MKNLLDQTLTAYAHCIRSPVAQRTFEEGFPRLTNKTSVGAGWEEGECRFRSSGTCCVHYLGFN